MTTWNLKHRDSLLGQVVDGLKELEADVPSPRLVLVKVTLSDEAGNEFGFCGVSTALDVLVNDLYFDERGNWSDAIKAKVETY